MAEESFADLMKRVRAGDQDAAALLVKRYEPSIRRAMRFRLSGSKLGAVLDSVDICQSVLASFFIRAASGQYELDSPQQLQKLLAAMAKNKLAFQVRKQYAQMRDQRRDEGRADDQALAGSSCTPSRQVSARELLDEVHKRLSPEERALVELRNDGVEWDEIATRMEGRPDALRKKLSRALDRVAEELGIDESSHE
jgi:DNA-directed RNA polymerase specialized sigma24 family protein